MRRQPPSWPRATPSIPAGCLRRYHGTTGPGAIHLLNGLYDACFDGAPVVALTGTTFHDPVGVRYQQDVDTVRLMQEVALYNVEVTGPEHVVQRLFSAQVRHALVQ